VVRRLLRSTARILIAVLVVIFTLVGAGLAVVETSWGKNRIRELIVRQANEYLTATLTIGSLDGSILRGVELHDIRLSRDERVMVNIDQIALSYSIKELFQSGTVIKRVRLVKPIVNLARLPDGRWDLAAIVKRERREGVQTGPGRPFSVQLVELTDGHVQVHDPLDFGAAHLPTDFRTLNATFSFEYVPVRWRLAFSQLSFDGRVPDLTMSRLNGAFGNGPGGWFFEKLTIETPRSTFVLDGRIVRGDAPTSLNLTVRASRFAFQEWGGVLSGLRNIAVEGPLQAALTGPMAQLVTDIDLEGTGGAAKGRVTLDTTVPGWRAAGAVNLGRLNLGRWLNDNERRSDITGHVTFDLALELGRHFPRGVYSFEGAHAMYMNYAADNLKARGQITANEVLIASATGAAYGADVNTHDGSIGLASPFPFRFRALIAQIDLRRVPATVPCPRRKPLTFGATSAAASPRPTSQDAQPLRRQVSWAPRLAPASAPSTRRPGRLFGRRRIATSTSGISAPASTSHGSGPSLYRVDCGTLPGRPRLRARDDEPDRRRPRDARGLFHGTLANADVTMSVENGTLKASYSGDFAGWIQPSLSTMPGCRGH
jgi:hypothetical protein